MRMWFGRNKPSNTRSKLSYPQRPLNQTEQTEPVTELNTIDQMYVYAGPSVYPGGWNISENIYNNEDVVQTLEANRSGAAVSGAGSVKKISYRVVAVFLGLLCLLLAGFIVMALFFIQGNSQLHMKMDLLQTRYDNLTREKAELQRTFDDMNKQRTLQGCQQPWVWFGGSCYYIFPSTKSWQESRNDCQQRGADLTIINSPEEQEFLIQFKTSTWIGLTDREREGTWKWVDGTPLTTRYWAPGEPNGFLYRDEDCAEITIHQSQESRNRWNDHSCDDKKSWICEKKLTT
ncbi:CD209 antigen-like protein E [Mugil cephalus]|uniref:CD209 antigen-like protein E n=1 Tax=Mugil cephalus TaxID=48193 RepID=UPI001FB651DA|nr:CD209 antigen-like protein E [Mugil cephalus]